jgi:hypothetical protein
VWGLLLSLQAAGIVLRCIDLAAFDDWMRQEARRDEPYLGLTTLFYPMGGSSAWRRTRRSDRSRATPRGSRARSGAACSAVLGLEPDRE